MPLKPFHCLVNTEVKSKVSLRIEKTPYILEFTIPWSVIFKVLKGKLFGILKVKANMLQKSRCVGRRQNMEAYSIYIECSGIPL